MKSLPKFVLQHFTSRPNLSRIVENIGWLFFSQVLRMFGGIIVGIWVARYLGPVGFGQLSYATALVGLFSAIAALGLPGIVVRDLVSKPETVNATLGSAFFIQLSGGFITFGIIVTMVAMLRPQDDLERVIVPIVGLTLVFNSSQVIKCWFESQVQSKYTVWIESSIFVFTAILKLVMLWIEAPLVAFASLILLEAILVCLGLFGIYRMKFGVFKDWSCQVDRAKALLRDAWPLIFAGVAVSVNLYFDKIMLNELVGPESVGLYSAAVSLMAILSFFPRVIAQSFFPHYVKSSSDSERFFLLTMKGLRFLTLLSVLLATILYLFAGSIIMVTYGEQYSASIEVAELLALNLVIAGMAPIVNNYLRIKNWQKKIAYRLFWAVLINITLNLLLIPTYGMNGAAIATITANLAVRVVYDLFDKDVAELNRAKYVALFGIRTNVN